MLGDATTESAKNRRAKAAAFSKTSATLWFLSIYAFYLLHSSCGAAPANPEEVPSLRPPHPEIQPDFLERHGILVALVAAAITALLWLALWHLTRIKPAVILPPEVQAWQALDKLRDAPENGETLSRISQILRRYITSAFQLPPGELTTAEFCAVISPNSQMGPELSSQLADFLRRCDERKFSPANVPPEIGSISKVLDLITLAESRRPRPA